MNNRLAFVDILKGIGILSVLLGHLLLPGCILKSIIYSFHMPLFFIAVGLVYKPQPVLKYTIKRIQSILIPYFIWALIFASFSFPTVALIVYGSNESLIYAGSNGMLWFLPCLFYSSIIAIFFINHCATYKKERLLLLLLTLSLLITSIILNLYHDLFQFNRISLGYPFGLDVVFLGAAFIMSGRLLKIIYKASLVLKVSMCLFVLFSFLSIFIKTKSGYQQMATFDVGSGLEFFFVSILVVIGLISISIMLEKTYLSKSLCWFGKNSLIIFIAHRMILYPIKFQCELRDSIYFYLLGFFALIVFSSFVSILINGLFPFLAGKMKYGGYFEKWID